MTTLSAEDIANLDRMVAEQASGVTPYSDETDCLIWAALPALIAMAKRPKWICFNCGFETSDEAEAEAHFGDGDGSPAICRWWYEEADEAIRLRAYQEEVIETAGAREAEYQSTQRAEKAEAEATRYREMAVRLATELRGLEKAAHMRLNAESIWRDPDIAQLLQAENKQ